MINKHYFLCIKMDIDKTNLLKTSKGESIYIAEYFKGIAHPMRLKVLITLALEGLCNFLRLKKLTDLSKTALANHLSQLENLKLIKSNYSTTSNMSLVQTVINRISEKNYKNSYILVDNKYNKCNIKQKIALLEKFFDKNVHAEYDNILPYIKREYNLNKHKKVYYSRRDDNV